MLSKDYKLFSAVQRCVPCMRLVDSLNKEFPEWKNYINYIDADNMSEDEMELAQKLSVLSLPTFADDNKILFRGFRPDLATTIKDLCITKE